MKKLNDYEQKLLLGWEEVHNKGQLSLWILLALKDGAKHMGQIKQFMATAPHDLLLPDDKSVYRTLRRFRDSELVDYTQVPSASGPDLKVYHLTTTGKEVLQAFAKRNIIDVYYQERIHKLIKEA